MAICTPSEKKAHVVVPLEAFREKVNEIIRDMELFQQADVAANSHLIHHDARERYESLDDLIDMVITSPPYPNNYDYGDATRLEMSFWHESEDGGTYKVLFGNISCARVHSMRRQINSFWNPFLDYRGLPLSKKSSLLSAMP